MRTKPRKWIREELAQLDPYRDYERIIALNTSYRMSDFLLDYVYAMTFPNFIASQHGSETVLRGGKGKIYTNPNKRMDDTSRHMLIWWENGPSSPRTQRSVESLNRLHEHWAKAYPENFSHTEDYIYTMCYEAAFIHRLRLRLGLAGFDESTQIAATEFWSRMTALFRNAGTGEPITGFPDSFHGVMEYMDWYEGRDLGTNPDGDQVIERMLIPFAQRHFPKPLHFLARALVLGIYPPHILRGHGIPSPGRPTQWFARSFLKFGLVYAEKYAADPEITIGERHRRARAKRIEGVGAAAEAEAIRNASDVAATS